MIRATIKLPSNFNATFRAGVKKEGKLHLKKRQSGAARKIQQLLGSKVVQILNGSQETAALLSNRVIAELGVVGMGSILQNIYQQTLFRDQHMEKTAFQIS